MDFRLPWRALDPRRRSSPDLEAAQKAALSALRRKKLRTSSGREAAEAEVRFLVWAAIGGWSSGWSDPVAAGGTSLVWQGAASVGEDDEATAQLVVAAIEDWQSWLVALTERFGALAAQTAEHEEIDALAKLAGALLPTVLERTGIEGDWPRTYARVVSWAAQAMERVSDDVSERIEATLEGRIAAGAAPSDEDAAALAEDLALELALRERPPFVEDALEAWWEVRASAPWDLLTPADQRGCEGDGHRRYIRTFDRARSSVRADAMARALVRARYGATKKLKLDLALLREWLELALPAGTDLSLRRSDAWSWDEAERYGRPKDLEARLSQALTEATTEGTSAISRAARVYLDLRFLSPFTTGNARAARLALDHVLTRGGLGLHDATPIFAIRRWAHEPTGPWRFQRVLAACVGPT